MQPILTPRRTQVPAARPVAALALAVSALSVNAAPAADSASIPEYRPAQQVSGLIRIWGNDNMGALLKHWQSGFLKYHPHVLFADKLKGSASAIYGLEARVADLAAMGRSINPFERYGTYERSWTYPVEIEVATGSADKPHKSPAFAIFLHKSNPLAKLTMKQLDGIFGGERGGGWEALSWMESAARPAFADLRSWGQLGVGGDFANKPIHPYGQPVLGAGVITFFQARVLHGGAMWNEDLREYEDRRRMIADLCNDPYGIAYAPLAYRNECVKPIALAETAEGPYVPLERKTVADRSYPLARPVYLVYTIDNEKSEISNPRVDPKVKEFLRYILSEQGQQAVARDGTYLPLTPAVVSRQRAKLDSEEFPPEKVLLGE